ncbi:nucleoside hydrolase [Bacillus weihaiensis]|uniref:nucleoside hydrolase n=1 Tax=Bacillus weihaiensis TaxID=1547283 RepID=UPI000AA3F704|nr:nucleoside hydrolase [Bacillus weihaiensis]
MGAITKKVLFIGDYGVDDIVSLLYAYYSEEIEVVGIVVDYGNISKQNALVSATYIQQLLNVRIPIIGGAVRPLTGETPIYYPQIHGEYGLGPIIPEVNGEITEFENFHEIISIIETYKDELIIVNVGRLTSLATAFVLYPNTLESVKEIYIMGGAFLYPGNSSPLAEANFYSDHYAANLVLDCATNVKIFPLNVTNYAILPNEIINQLNSYFMKMNDKAGLLLKPMITYYSNWYKQRDPNSVGGPLHDLLTFWAVANNEAFKFIKKPVDISTTDGETRGVSIGDFRPYKELADYPIHDIALEFDYQKFINNVYNTFTNK